MILRFFRRDEARATIEALYGAIVAQARDPVLYTDFAVPDTVEGRFEMIVLHAFALFHRLKDEPEARRALGQGVFDAFCRDMDSNLREMGVGDLTVPKKMKKVGEAFYGRVAAYDAALAGENDDALAAALLRNVYGSREERESQARGLAAYLRRAVAALVGQPYEQLHGGTIRFPAVLSDPLPDSAEAMS